MTDDASRRGTIVEGSPLSPAWFSTTRPVHACVDGGRVSVLGCTVEFDERPFPDGTVVEVRLAGRSHSPDVGAFMSSFLAVAKPDDTGPMRDRVSIVDVEARARADVARAEDRTRDDEARIARLVEYRSSREAEAADRLADADRSTRELRERLPFRWTTGTRVVLSGLSERSAGSGENRRSVRHVRLLEDVSIGRLRRRAGELLCTTTKAHWWDASDESGTELHPSCPRCIAMARRIAASTDETKETIE